MKTATYLYKKDDIIATVNNNALQNEDVSLLIGFGEKSLIEKSKHYHKIQSIFPNATIVLASSAGEIFKNTTQNNSISLIGFCFKSTQINSSKVQINAEKSSFDCGRELINQLPKKDLKWVFVLSDGSKVNGSELVRGMNSVKPDNVLITGGLAGDGTNFKSTLVGINEIPKENQIVAVGFYGEKLKISHGSLGGWDTFGIEKIITKSENNILYEIDHLNALELYKKYLGKYVDELPSSALLFPIALKLNNSSDSIVRTILSIDEDKQSMTFAGDVPEGSKIQFMKANFDKLIDAASEAAENCLINNNNPAKAAILISCIGRKIILSNRIDEEIEAIEDIFGKETLLTGFYSYGEISPLNKGVNCELHNQTMTITTINELD